MTKAIRKGELKKIERGVVDYIAEGEFIRDGERIPCEIGYLEDNLLETTDYCGVLYLEAVYIFIKRDGITDNGNHYYKETIDIRDNPYIDVSDEEV